MTHNVMSITNCSRCGLVIMIGFVDGLMWRVDPYLVPTEDARVLKHYGVTPLVLDWLANRWLADVWAPGQHDLARPHRYLVAPHVCGSAHAQREETS